MKKIFRSIALVIGLAILFLIFNTVIDRESSQKLAAMSMLGCGEMIKKNPSEDKVENHNLDVTCRSAISEIRHTKDDQIILYNQKYQLLLTYSPTNTRGKIEWKCSGQPKKYFPHQCHT